MSQKEPRIVTRNTSSPVFGRPEWYDWSIYLEGDQDTLNSIQDVTYYLHPTFPNPIRTVSNPKDGFRLSTRGWGEFEIKIMIKFKNGQTQTLYHWLALAGPTPLDKQ